MFTQLEEAKKGTITPEMKAVALEEGIDAEVLRADIAAGHTVLPANRQHRLTRLFAIGRGLRTKVNANVGTSDRRSDLAYELEKLDVALKAGADSVMDLSTSGDLPLIRREIIKASPVMVGAVPIYAFAAAHLRKGGTPGTLDSEAFFEAIEAFAADGMDYVTVHCGVTKKTVRLLEKHPRLCGVVSKGGSIHAAAIRESGKENPMFEHFDRLCDICLKYDMTISLGDGFRPGAIADANDAAQFGELEVLGELQQYAFEHGVQTIIEGPGHVPMHLIEGNVQKEKEICHGAPFYVLGPLPIDTGAAHDHITAAIGGAIAAAAGVDMLCYVTPAEHLRLPDLNDVREGVIATRIAAQCGDVVKNVGRAQEMNIAMSTARKNLDWLGMFKNAIDPEGARKMRHGDDNFNPEACSMCGDLCAIKIDNKRMGK